MNNESVILFILFISILSFFCGWVGQSFTRDEMYSTSVSLKSRACVGVCVRARKFEISPIQIEFKSKVGISESMSGKRVKKKIPPPRGQSTIERVYMQIYDIIFLVWSLWVGVFEHRAFQIGNMFLEYVSGFL